jgi:hypothetical protein
MPYTHFRYIAYQVPTVAQDNAGNAIYGIPAGTVKNPCKLYGDDLDDLDDDAQWRIVRLMGVMEAAREKLRLAGLDNDSTLKVFLAPEFYFRPARQDVSYTYEEYLLTKDALRDTIEKYDFAHWLVVAGTILYQADKHSYFHAHFQNNEVVYFNASVYVFVSDTSDRVSHTIQKVHASAIDGIPTGRHGGSYPRDPSKLSSSDMWPKYLAIPKTKKHLFTAGGIQFGLDICLDHAYAPPNSGYMDVRITKHAVKELPELGVQLHLLVAGGMPIEKQSVAAVKQGYILRDDGYSEDPMTNCQQVSTYQGDLGNIVTSDNLEGSAILNQDIAIAQTIDIDSGHPLFVPKPPGCDQNYWNNHPQKINIYERQQIH